MGVRWDEVWGETKALGRLAAPIAVAQAGQALMGTVDTAVAGRAGMAVLGGVGLGNALFFAVACFGMGAMMGVDPLIAQAWGAGESGRARRFLWQGSWLAVGLSALLALPVLAIPFALPALGVDADVAREAGTYVLWRLPQLLPLLLYTVARSYLQAVGRTLPLVWAVLTANVLNLLADILFVFGGASLPEWTGPLRAVPAMGAAGAALATVLCTVWQWGLLAWAIRALPAPSGVVERRPVAGDLRAALRVGLPIGAHFVAEVGVFSLSGVLAGRLGEASIAAHQIALTYGSLSFCAAVGIGSAGSVRVGWAVGAGDSARARRSGMVAFAAGAGFMSLCALGFLLFPRPLALLLTDVPEVLAVAVPLLFVCAAFQVSDGLQGVGAGVLRGAGDTHFTFVANLVGHYLLGLPLALLLGLQLGWGVQGIWWGLCLGLSAVAVSVVLRFRALVRRPLRPLETREVAARRAEAAEGA